MRATFLDSNSPAAVRAALSQLGWDDARAASAVEGTAPGGVLLSALDAATIERLVSHAGGTLGLEVLTGDDGALITGSRSRLSALARPWGGPPELAEVAYAVGRALPGHSEISWTTARGPVLCDGPVIAGILNVTPDSFSDGGRWASLESAVAHASDLVERGALMVDVGGESTRPGRPRPVDQREELDRVIPVVEELVRRFPDLIISVDTVKSAVAAAALDAGAAAINDVSALRSDPAVAQVVAARGAGLILMHSRGDVTEMASYDHAVYPGGLVSETIAELESSLEVAAEAGVTREQIVVDPGLGFGKRVGHNLVLLDQLSALAALGRPIMVGPSRKRFLGAVSGRPVEQRDNLTAVACALAFGKGARIFRVHEPSAARDALNLAQALTSPESWNEDDGK